VDHARGAGGLRRGAVAVDAVALVTRPIQALAGAIFGGGRVRDGQRMADVQQRLAARGFNPGPIDGEFGPQTEQALYAFQAANGLRPTGRPDRETLRRL